mmetsp:Transcript_5573/g.13578  ORF Transcript_5573/g.13578 Transcript_5573/m.13578 type:complete len:197 (+) Transcript_5573:154-744(+)
MERGKDRANSTIPCLVVPPVLGFSSDVSGHKKILTLYNPLNYVLQFKVLSTRPDSYKVAPSSGIVAAQSSLDIVVKLKVGGDKIDRKHKFLVRVFNTEVSVSGDQVVGVKYSHKGLEELETLAKIKADIAKQGLQAGKKSVKAKEKTVPLLYPFIIGSLLVALLASYEHPFVDSTSKMFISYLLGCLITAVYMSDR